MHTTSESTHINGFFVALDDEIVTFKQGRAGVFYEKEGLVETLSKNAALKNKVMHIVEIAVPRDRVIQPNGVKFGIRGGDDIPITMVLLTKALLEG